MHINLEDTCHKRATKGEGTLLSLNAQYMQQEVLKFTTSALCLNNHQQDGIVENLKIKHLMIQRKDYFESTRTLILMNT